MRASGEVRLVAEVVDGLPAEVQVTIYRVVECLVAIMARADVEAWFETRQRRLGGCGPDDLILAGGGERVLCLAQELHDRAIVRLLADEGAPGS